MKKVFISLVLLAILSLGAHSAFAQSSGDLQLGLSRDWGYGGFGNDIQGLFTMKIKDPPEGLSKVVFMIDGNPIGEDTQAPYAYQFNTDAYPLGIHSLTAVGYDASGQDFNSNTIQAEFVPASSATGFIVKLVGPILGVVALLVLISVGIPMLRNRGKISSVPAGAQRKYGIGGGTICPNCGRPFPLKLWWINLGFNKIDRCPNCGRFGFFRPRSLTELRAAEAAELTSPQPGKAIIGESEADKLQKDLDDSKYQNF
jgi:hypothetical protein